MKEMRRCSPFVLCCGSCRMIHTLAKVQHRHLPVPKTRRTKILQKFAEVFPSEVDGGDVYVMMREKCATLWQSMMVG